MKKIVSDFAKSFGVETFYSGKTKTMYFNSNQPIDIEQKIIDKFGYSLPFKLSTNCKNY
jgi:hypothetical protein